MRFFGKHQQGKRAKWAESTMGYEHRKASKPLRLLALYAGGRGGIRTHGRLPYTAFRVRLVMTTSILFRIFLPLRYPKNRLPEIGQTSWANIANIWL